MESKAARIYSSVYSGIQVLEAMVRGVAVMKRKSDGYVNATQILKVAGVEKGKRTKILEKDITNGEHEKIQGGYGKYQGTWIPLERGRELANQYGVGHLLIPIFDHVPSTVTDAFMPPSRSNSSTQQQMQRSRLSDRQSAASALSRPRFQEETRPGLVLHNESYSALAMLQRSRAQMPPAPATYGQVSALPAHAEALMASRGPPTSDQQGKVAHLKRNRMNEVELQSGAQTGRNHSQGNTAPESYRTNGDLPPPAKKARIEQSVLPDDRTNGTSAKARFTQEELDPNRSALAYASVQNHLDRQAVTARQQSVLLAIYADDRMGLLAALSAHPGRETGSTVETDFVVDDEGHTALHWAAALARENLVDALVQGGADVSKGNSLGETALMRSVMSSINHEEKTFGFLLSLLSASIRTVDTTNRSVLHHIAYLAAVKGRSLAARHYMQTLLDWVARHQGGDFRSLVDLQDIHGDTALNIAARIGNRSLVRMLLDVGANRALANKLDLRPGDFGVDGDNLQHQHVEDVFSSLRTNQSAPIQRSNTIISGMTTKIDGLSAEFAAEVQAKQDAIQMNQVHLRAATRNLADQRRQIQTWQARCGELDQVKQRVRNVQKALIEEDQFDWTGRSGIDVTGSTVDLSFDFDADPPVPAGDSLAALIKLRRIKAWSARAEIMLSQRLERLKGASVEKEVQCKKIVSLCTKVPVEQVEDILEQLLVAVESDGQGLDLDRVSGFLLKVRNGNI